MIIRSCPNSLHHTLRNYIAIFLILAAALIHMQTSVQAQIAFSSDRGGDVDIYVMDEDGSNVIQLTNHPSSDVNPDWSPDGTQIAFETLRHERMKIDRNFEIYVMDADGGNPARLTDDPLVDAPPLGLHTEIGLLSHPTGMDLATYTL